MRITVKQVLAQAGVDLDAALGQQSRPLPAHWQLATPVSDPADPLESSRLFRSIGEQVNDDRKRGCFATMVNGLGIAAQHQKYQDVLQGSSIAVKVAYAFKYGGANRKLWELKEKNKDRIYFFTLSVVYGKSEVPVIALLVAHHKKDQTTPKEVIRYCEPVMKAYLDPSAQNTLC